MNTGDTVYFCEGNECIEVIYLGSSNLDCKIELDGHQFMVDCNSLQSNCARFSTEDIGEETDTSFAKNQRVIVRLVDSADTVRLWPATVKAIYSNDKLALALDDLGGRVTVEKSKVLGLATKE